MLAFMLIPIYANAGKVVMSRDEKHMTGEVLMARNERQRSLIKVVRV